MGCSWLFERLESWGEKPALIDRGEVFTYAQLLAGVEDWNRDLERLGAMTGDVVMFEGDYSFKTACLLLSLIYSGTVAAPVSLVYRPHRDQFEEIASARLCLDFQGPDEYEARALQAGTKNPLLLSLTTLGKPGLIIFSSGTTGTPKASLHDCERFLKKFETARAPLVTVAVPPIDHMSGLDTFFYTLSSGGTLVCPEQRDLAYICRLIAKHHVELFPASAALLNLILVSEAHKDCDLSSVKLIAYGSDIMPEPTLARLKHVFPGASFLQKYGTTELGSPRTRSKEEGSLFIKIESDGVEYKVKDGSLWIRSQSAMLGYLNAPSPFDEEGWMDTEDLVEQDGEYIRILGRRTEMINVGGQKVYPAEVENVLMQMDNVLNATVFGTSNPIVGNVVNCRLTLKEAEESSSVRKRLLDFCKGRLADFKIPMKIHIQTEAEAVRYKKDRKVQTSG